MPSQQDFLDEASGESYDAFKFNTIGDVAAGIVMTDPRPVERASLRDGNPETQLPVNLQTPEGPRTLWVRQGFLAKALADAVKEAGATMLVAGGKLAVEYIEDRDTGRPNKAKIYKARYEAPAVSPSGKTIDDIFAQ